MNKNLKEITDTIISKNKTLFILCGLPYSGKTYFAKEIINIIPIEYISIDNIFHERGYDWNSNKLPNDVEWAEIFDISYKKVRNTLNNSLNVLYDSTNHTKISRDTLRKVASEVGAETNVIFVDTPLDTIYKRWEENKLKPTRSIVDKKLVDMTIESFERPTEDENTLIINI